MRRRRQEFLARVRASELTPWFAGVDDATLLKLAHERCEAIASGVPITGLHLASMIADPDALVTPEEHGAFTAVCVLTLCPEHAARLIYLNGGGPAEVAPAVSAPVSATPGRV